MKTDDFLTLKHFTVHKGTMLVPATDDTREWLEMQRHGTELNFKQIEARDVKFHRAYFALLSYIWERLPAQFRNTVSKDSFYEFLKMLGNEYDNVYTFKDGRTFIKYHSISFGRMNQSKFREYVNNQLTTIYEELLIPLEMDWLMDDINDEFERFIDKLL